MKKNGYTIVELLIVLAVFGLAYFMIANKVSYAFKVDYNSEIYNQTITSIEKNAKIYAENNLDLFKEGKDVYLTVADLAQKNLVFHDNNGVVSDPRENGKTLNDLKVKLTLESDNSVTVKVLG